MYICILPFTLKQNNIKEKSFTNQKKVEIPTDASTPKDQLKIHLKNRFSDTEYLLFLGEWSQQYRNYSDHELRKQITSKKMDKTYGVTVAIVREDIANYQSKYVPIKCKRVRAPVITTQKVCPKIEPFYFAHIREALPYNGKPIRVSGHFRRINGRTVWVRTHYRNEPSV